MTIHCVLVVFEGIFVRKRNSLSLGEGWGEGDQTSKWFNKFSNLTRSRPKPINPQAKTKSPTLTLPQRERG